MSAPSTRLVAIRRLVAVGAALLGGAACANQGLPRGGPEDFGPPQVLRITPEHKAVTTSPGAVTIAFDEVVSETPKGGRDLAELVFISPKSGKPRVDWNRKSISIRPSKGWKKNTIYTVQLKAGVQDLYNNALDSSLRVVFSTGGEIPDSRIKGVVFDWPEGKPLGGAIVEAVSQDTTVVFQTVADSVGRFELESVPIGPYFLRAYQDRNTNKDLDPLEIWDSVRVSFTGFAETEFYAFGRDTVGLRIATTELADSNRVVKVVFDKPYALDQFFVPEGVQLVRLPDSLPIGIKLIQTARQKLLADSLALKRKADSAAAEAAKRDSSVTPEVRARRDSIAAVRKADSVSAAARQREREGREAARRAGRRYVPPDTTPPPTMRRPKVFKEVYVTLDSALPAGRTYRLQMTGVKSLNAIVKAPVRNFTIPRARVDSTRRDTTARRDTIARPDTSARRDTTIRRDSSVRVDTMARRTVVQRRR